MLSDSLVDWLADPDCESDVDAEYEWLLVVEPLGSQDSDGAESDRLVDWLSESLVDSLLVESLCDSLEVDSESDCELSLVDWLADDSDADDSLTDDWLEAVPDDDDSDSVDPLVDSEPLVELIESLLLEFEAELSDDVLLALDEDDLLESDDSLEVDERLDELGLLDWLDAELDDLLLEDDGLDDAELDNTELDDDDDDGELLELDERLLELELLSELLMELLLSDEPPDELLLNDELLLLDGLLDDEDDELDEDETLDDELPEDDDELDELLPSQHRHPIVT